MREISKPCFELGKLVMTAAVRDLATQGLINPAALVARHHGGDWGDLSAGDKNLNEQALLDGDRILSAYETPAGKFYVITEWDRTLTTVLLPDEY